MSFETTVPGKWILAGEHSVLRGSAALVFPLQSRFLELQYLTESKTPLKLELEGDHGDELQLLFWGVLEKACNLTKTQRSDLKGTLKLRSSIPVGAGLGASAALCVALGRWFFYLKLIQESEIYEFSRTLENLFHGESSGLDIAVALSGRGIRFVRDEKNLAGRKTLEMNWQPKWYLSYSGKRGVTSECVNKVKCLIQKDPVFGEQIDYDMKKAVALAEKALMAGEAPGFALLQEAMSLAQTCFQRWNLDIPEHSQWLQSLGAAAVKPTGSGDGGYVLSLWKQEPPHEALKRLIPVQR